MDIKAEVRRRITELTRFAYERGHRDGAQSALAEIESIAAEDVIEQIGSLPAPLKAIAGTKVAGKKPAKTARSRAAKEKPAPKARRAKAKAEQGRSKQAVVQDALQALLAEKGSARRDEILVAAQATNPAINKHDLNNGLRALTKRSQIRVAPDDKALYLPAEAAG